MHKLLLILLTLALAVAPLRGTWAAAETSSATAGNTSHCEQMQHADPPANTDVHADHDLDKNAPGQCSHDCDSSCCNAACSACVHVTSAIQDTTPSFSGSATGTLNTTSSPLFPERPAVPLLHPPAYARS